MPTIRMARHVVVAWSLALAWAAAVAAQDTAQLVLATGSPTPCVWSPDCSTPGVKLILESSKTKLMGREFLHYGLAASGLPAGKLYTFWLYPFSEDHPIPLVTGFTGDSVGGLSCADSAPHSQGAAQERRSWCTKWDGLFTSSSTFVPSEPYRAALISTDDSVRAYAIEFPAPVAVTTGPCHLQLELLSRDKSAFKVVGTGFVAGEEARVVSRSGKEEIQATRQIPATGTFWVLLAPALRGKKGGKASFSVTTTACSPVLEYAWGKDLK